MKTNAIIRIVIWSIVIVLLLGIMGSVFFAVNPRFTSSRVEETAIAVPLTTAPVMEGFSATVNAPLNIRTAPNAGADVNGMLEAGDTVTITRYEFVNGANWAYISTPMSGWIMTDGLDMETALSDDSVPAMSSGEPGDKYAVSSDEVKKIEIEWAAGDILIQPGNVEAVTFSEDNVTDGKYAMLWKQSGSKLCISFCEDTSFGFGITVNSNLSKDLTITVPRDWICEGLEIDAASATVEVNDLTIREVDFDGASGTCEFENCTVEEFDVDTASGDIRFVGCLDVLDCDAASASVYAVLSNTPSRLDMDTMSGDLDITLPEDTGFSVSMGGLSTNFTSDFETTVKNGNHVCGDGSCRINIDAMSGDVLLRRGEHSVDPTAETAAVSHHVHSQLCQSDPNSCPDTHQHTESCTADPSSCPKHTEAAHQHSETCTTDPASCPDHTVTTHSNASGSTQSGASADQSGHHQEKEEHH